MSSGRAVVVKVQYPEVAAHYAADFDNLEALTSLLLPENLVLVQVTMKRGRAVVFTFFICTQAPLSKRGIF